MSTLPNIDNSWMFDLVSDDPRQRGEALARNDVAVAECREKWRRFHDLYERRWTLGDAGQDVPASLIAAYDQALGALRDAEDATLIGLVARHLAGETDLAPYSALFLVLENRYPDTWDRELAEAPPWPVKRAVLRTFGDSGVPASCRDLLVDAVVDAVYRLQRCEDRRYPALARHLDSPELRAELIQARDAEDVVVAARAGYTLWALDNPDAPVTPASWRDWLVAGF